MNGRTSNRGGFTLLELLMVVVIIAILASVAVPQYIRTVERARQSEGIALLGQVRQAAIRARSQFDPPTFAPITAVNQLDVDPDDVIGVPRFTYARVCSTVNDIVISATRNGNGTIGNCVAGYVMNISANGAVGGRSCQTTTSPACI